jgi:hypothetical protein
MARSKGRAKRTVEIGIPVGAMLDDFERAARQREVSLAQHCYDLLRAVWLAQQGEDMSSLLRVPGAGGAAAPPEPPPEPPPAAAAAASAWLELLDD